MAKLISRTYGEALYELAVEENKEEQFLEEAAGLLDVMKQDPELNQMMGQPKITKEEKISTLESVFRGRISDELLGFLILTVQKDRYSEIRAILAYFIDQMKEHQGIGIAKVQTAVPLSEDQKKQVEAKLLETTKYQQMEMHYQVQPELIGGMVIRIGDRVVDSSIRSKLNGLERDLQKIQLSK